MDRKSMRAELIGWLMRHGASAEMLASFTAHWDTPSTEAGSPQPEGPCPACFREGRVAIVELLSSEGGWCRAQCMDCGGRYLWSVPGV